MNPKTGWPPNSRPRWNLRSLSGDPAQGCRSLRNELICVHPDNFQEVIWSSGADKRFGLGPYMIADNKLFILDDDATLTIARPSTSEYIELDSYRVLEGHDAWGPAGHSRRLPGPA
jgi:hypothetical protein